jgi:hypothetical protein
MAAPNIRSVAIETKITLGIELGWFFITVTSLAANNTAAARLTASNISYV